MSPPPQNIPFVGVQNQHFTQFIFLLFFAKYKKKERREQNEKKMKYDGRKFILKLVGKTNLTHSRDSSLFPSKEESKKFNEIVLCGVDSKFEYLSPKLIHIDRRAPPIP